MGRLRSGAVTSRDLHLIIPGPLEQRTGGYVYDRRIVEGLRRLGWTVHVHGLEGAFPDPDPTAVAAMRAALESIPAGAIVVIDGLAMGGLPEPVRDHAQRLRVIALIHHPLADETGLSVEDQNRLRCSERAALGPCSGVIVTSAFTAGVVAAYDVPPDRIVVVPPGTEPAPAAAGPGEGRPPALLCVATVTPRKGHDVLVDALERLRDLPWSCTCVGSLDRTRDFARAVQEKISRADLDDRVHLVGERTDIELAELYHGASLFVLASHYEGYGMVLMEAIARGLPVVSTTGGAIPFTVPSEAAILVPPGNGKALADALRHLLTDDAHRAGIAAAARRHADEIADWDVAARSFAAAVDVLTS